MKLTLLCLGIHLMRNETLEYCSDLLDMFFKCFGVDQDIVDIDNDRFVEHVSEDIVDESLEDRQTNKIFVVSSSCRECSFPLIFLSNTNQVVSTAEIKLGIVLGHM